MVDRDDHHDGNAKRNEVFHAGILKIPQFQFRMTHITQHRVSMSFYVVQNVGSTKRGEISHDDRKGRCRVESG